MQKNRVLVFDVDDTISIHKNRDYEHAKPIQQVIDKLNKLHDEGYYIKLFTGRGQLSCNGNLDLIIKTKEPTLKKWLKEHNVKYDELIFGKPLGDWYIDDKGMSVNDFLSADFVDLKGGSNSIITKEFDKVIKTSKSSQMQNSWYKVAKEFGLNIPEIYSCVGDTLYMSYIEGIPLVDCCTKDDISQLVNIVYSKIKLAQCADLFGRLDDYCKNLFNHLNNDTTKLVVEKIKNNEKELLSKVSWCHGDFTLSNMIKKNNEIYFIDPNFKNDYNSYLLDLAKIRQSLENYEYLFGLSISKNKMYRDFFDSIINKEDLYLVKLLEITHWIRMYDYKLESERYKVINMIEKLLGELDGE